MYKLFALAAAIAFLPVSPRNMADRSTRDEPAGSWIFNFHFKNSGPAGLRDSSKKAAAPYGQDWLHNAQENIRKSEYNFTWEKKLNTYCTPNRKNNLRFFYTDKGFSVEPRTTRIPIDGFDPAKRPDEIKYRQLPNWKIQFTLDKKQVGWGLWKTDGNKAEYITDKITVQYNNDDEGMRQNFVVHRPLSANNQLNLNFSIKTMLKSRLNNNRLQFFHKKVNVLNYQDLWVWDAGGKPLPAYFKKRKKGKYAILVDTRGAQYPITIDPISTGITGTPDWQGDDADQAGASFGESVSSAGDINGDGYSDVIIGAPRFDDGANLDEGRAFVYHGSAVGLSATPSSMPDDADQADAFFGISVAGAGDVNGDGYSDVIIGAFLYDDGGNADEGRAYVYHGSPAGLLASPSSTPDDCNQAGAQFGVSVAGAGDVNGDGYSDVIIGAGYFQDGANTREGRAFVYYGSASGIGASPASTPDDANQIFAEFGTSVAGAGDVNGDGYSDVVIGAPMWDEVPTYTNDGKCFVYFGSAAGLSASPNNILDATNENNANLGISVACAGDVNGDGYSDIIAGAPGLDDGANFDEGKAFIFFGSAGGSSSSPAITLDDADQLGASFGASVACAGDVNGDGYSDVIIGAELYDDSNTDEGVCFIYYGNAAGTMASPISKLDDANQDNASFGSCVASAGDVNGDGYSDVIIGAYFYTDGANAQEGTAFVYQGTANGISSLPTTFLQSNQINAQLGYTVASAGDVNGDGYSDVVIGSWLYDNGQTNEGAAFIYHGSAAGLNPFPSTTLQSDMANAYLGVSVAAAGDVNGDGYSDVIAGAYGYQVLFANQGVAFIYLGSSGGINTTAASTLTVYQTNAYFGSSVAGTGDLNGDGYADVAVGAPYYDNGQTDEGAAFVYLGSASGVNTTAVATMESDQTNAYMGNVVAGGGDVNGDGYSDLLVGAYFLVTAGINDGAVFVYQGSSGGINTTASTKLISGQNNSQNGEAVACAGDVNGDGYSDVIVGAPYYNNGTLLEGAAFLYLGSAAGLGTTPASTLSGGQFLSRFGYAVSGAGDVNGDGYSDVLVGVSYFDDGEVDEGAGFLYLGGSSGLNTTPVNLLEANQGAALYGRTVATAGDVNGDGYSDILMGSPTYDNGQTDEGATFVYMGDSSNSNLRNNIRIYNTDLSTPVNSSNFIFSQFGAGLYAKSFIGRAKGKLVWETRLNYNPWTGTPITNSTFYTAQQLSYTDMGLAGIELKSLISKIPAGGKYTKLRARVKYDPVTAITGQVYSPWRYVSSVIDANNLGVLPIELISFSAVWKQKGKSALLNFVTDKESGTSCFDIEKSSDGFNFHTIATINARNLPGRQSYSWTDDNATARKQYYRIAIKGLAGQLLYSNVQMLDYAGTAEILVFPNPAKDILQLQLNKASEKINFRVINAKGQLVMEKLELLNGRQTLSLPLRNLPPGAYWLRLQTDEQIQVLQFVKE